MKISVIIPVYNVEKYLKKCILSIWQQNFPKEEFEIIAVNDGATDNSPQLLEKIRKEVINLKIVHQENRGLSGARNTGIENSLGEYILFVDADDYILPNTLTHLYELAIKNSLDILEFAALGVDEKGKTTYTAIRSSNGIVYSGEEYLGKVSYMNSACNKLYKRTFLNKNQLRFMEGVYIEDIEFNTRAVFVATKIQAIDFIGAHFLQRSGSITRSTNFNKKEKMIYDIHKVLSSINNFTETTVTSTSKAYTPLKKTIGSLIATLLLRVLKDIKNTDVRKNIINQLKSQELYPTHLGALTMGKRLFLKFANLSPLFAISNNIISSYNRLRYGK